MKYQLTGTLDSVMLDLAGGTVSTLHVNERNLIQKALTELKDKKVSIEIKQYREKRSLNANAYAWQLMGQIAEELDISNDEVYHMMLVQYGTPVVDDDGKSVMFSLRSDIELGGEFWIHSAPVGTSEVKGKLFTHYRMIKGSSEYDTKEMSRLIDGIVYEAQQLDIETKTPQELASMCERWEVRT